MQTLPLLQNQTGPGTCAAWNSGTAFCSCVLCTSSKCIFLLLLGMFPVGLSGGCTQLFRLPSCPPAASLAADLVASGLLVVADGPGQRPGRWAAFQGCLTLSLRGSYQGQRLHFAWILFPTWQGPLLLWLYFSLFILASCIVQIECAHICFVNASLH